VVTSEDVFLFLSFALGGFSVVHVMLERLFVSKLYGVSSQVFFFKFSLVSLGVTTACFFFRFDLNNTETFHQGLSLLLLFLSITVSFYYSYFHLFNMSQTATRVKIISDIRSGEILAENVLDKHFKGDLMIINRLERLIEMRQIRILDDGTYQLRSETFLRIGVLLGLLGSVIAGKRRE
jgi:hypothetical protein